VTHQKFFRGPLVGNGS